MNQAWYLALDQGGHASRAIVFDHRGDQVASATVDVAARRDAEGRVEHDAGEVAESLRSAIRQVLADLGTNAMHVRAAGLATQRSNIICWDRGDGRPLSPILSWQDRRAADWLSARIAGQEWIHGRTGLFPNAHYGASKLYWCLHELPEVATAGSEARLAMGPMASFLAMQLTGAPRAFADPANASRTLLWNIATGDWDADLLRLFEIPRPVLPACVPSRHAFGRLIDWPTPLPLEIVTGDQSAALFAYGEPDPGAVYTNMGTGAFVQRPLTALLLVPRLLSSLVFRDASASCFVLEGTVNGAGAALDYWAARVGLEAGWQPRLADWMQTRDLDAPVFLNGVSGLGSPFWRPEFPISMIGNGDVAAQMVAVAESIAFLVQENLREMDACLPAPKRMIVSGGLARVEPLCQRLADLSSLVVARREETEASARGLAFLLAGRPGDWNVGGETHFRPSRNTTLAARHERWRETMADELGRLTR